MDQQELRKLEHQCIQEEPPWCTATCPIHVDARGFVKQVRKGDWTGARKILAKTMPFPGILGRICDHPCQDRCIRNRAGDAIAVGALERTCVESTHPGKKVPPLPKQDKSVAVLGSGFSSLTAAWDLIRKGYTVTLFESENRLGGSLRYIDPGLLPGEVIDQETDILTDAGVTIETEHPLNPDTIRGILENFDAVYLGLDTEKPIDTGFAVAPDPFTGSTELTGLFTGGSAPEKADFSPVNMAAQGRWAATSMDRYLQNVSLSAGREKEGSYDTRLFTSLEGVESRPAVDPADPKKGYTGEEAVQEAGRCLQCECLECVKICPYLAHYRGYPRKYAREIYNNASIVMGERKANTMINTCSLCRLCETICPEDFSMAGLCHEARTDMIQKDRMPPSAHEFALQDMDFSNSDKFALARHQPGFDTSTHLFYPGCHLSGTAPEHVFSAYSYLSDQLSGGVGLMLGCCGAPAWWSGREARFQEILGEFKTRWTEMGTPRIITACTSCHQMFSEGLPEAEVISLWEVLEKAGLPEKNRPEPPKTPVAVIDPCTVRHKPKIRTSARRLLEALNIKVDELKFSGELTECCGFGGLMGNANPPVARKVLERRVQQSPRDYLAYCGMCRDRLAHAGKRTVHLLDFIWKPETAIDPAEREDPGFSYRHENRARLKNRFLREVWKERTREMEAYEKIALDIPKAVRERLESRRILTEDVQKVLHHVHEAKGPVFENSETGRYLAYYRPVKVTFWVEYTPQHDGSFLIHNAYSHRMEIIEEP